MKNSLSQVPIFRQGRVVDALHGHGAVIVLTSLVLVVLTSLVVVLTSLSCSYIACAQVPILREGRVVDALHGQSGVDCLICAEFAQLRFFWRLVSLSLSRSLSLS